MSSFSAVYRMSLPGAFSHRSILLFKLRDLGSSSHSFMVMYDKPLGIRMNQWTPNTTASLNFIDVILQIPICYRRRKRKRNTSFLYTWYTSSFMVYTHFRCVVVVIFSVSLKRKKYSPTTAFYVMEEKSS